MTAIDFAAYIHARAQSQGHTISITKIQKWLFICYGLHLAAGDEHTQPLFEERPMCWPYGPVFSSVFTHQKDKKEDFSDVIIDENDFSEYEHLVDIVLAHFGKWTAKQLSEWTHRAGTSWDLARKRDPYVPQRVKLDPEEIRTEFRGYLAHE